MNTLGRFLLREFFRMALACGLGFLVLFLVIDLVEASGTFLKHNATAGEILRYYLYRIPGLFYLFSPLVVLLAVLISVSLRTRGNEFTAMFSAGISSARACAPLFAGCILVTALAFADSEVVAPYTNKTAREIARFRIRPGKVAAQFSLNRYWIRGTNAILSAQVVDAASRTLSGFQYFEINGDFRVVRRIDARQARHDGAGNWLLMDGRERRFGENFPAVPFERKEFPFPETIQGFLDGETPPGEMTFVQLSDYVEDAQARGYDVRRYEVDLHAKLSYPLLNVAICLIAVPFGLRMPRSGGVWRSIGTGILIGFCCWLTLSLSLSLGRKGVLPPIPAAWLPDALFTLAGVLLFRRSG
jgi:lipopolysaccharide export system permease protein